MPFMYRKYLKGKSISTWNTCADIFTFSNHNLQKDQFDHLWYQLAQHELVSYKREPNTSILQGNNQSNAADYIHVQFFHQSEVLDDIIDWFLKNINKWQKIVAKIGFHISVFILQPQSKDILCDQSKILSI